MFLCKNSGDCQKIILYVHLYVYSFPFWNFISDKIQFSHFLERGFKSNLNSHLHLDSSYLAMFFQTAVDKISYQGYKTYTAHAINTTVNVFKDSPQYAKAGNSKVMILITGGRWVDVHFKRIEMGYSV